MTEMTKMTKKIVNPNRLFSQSQTAQMEAAFGSFSEVAAGVNFPQFEVGGMAKVAYASAMSYPDEIAGWLPTGLSIGAAATIVTLHGRDMSKFPKIIVMGSPPAFDFLGTVNLDEVRNLARTTRYQKKDGKVNVVAGKVVVLNFSHPINEPQRDEIAKLLSIEVGELEVREDLSRQYRYETVDELVEAVTEQVEAAELSAFDWQKAKIIVNLPAHSAGAMILLAMVHGRMGYFPNALRIERDDSGFHFTDVVELESLREAALREIRSGEERVLVNKKDLRFIVSCIMAGDATGINPYEDWFKAISEASDYE